MQINLLSVSLSFYNTIFVAGVLYNVSPGSLFVSFDVGSQMSQSC